MIEINQLQSLDEVTQFIETNELAFLYISQENCSVCHALLPQVQALLENYPKIELAKVDAIKVPAVAGAYSVFTVPVLLLFIEGKEYIREARIVHMELLKEKLEKIYKNMV